VVLSPVGLGRFVPDAWYTALLGGEGVQQQLSQTEQQYKNMLQQELDDLEQSHQQRMDTLEASDVSPAATQEATRQYEQARQILEKWIQAETPVDRLIVDRQRQLLESAMGAASQQALQQAQVRYRAQVTQLEEALKWSRDRQAAMWVVAVMSAIAVVMAAEPLLSPEPAGQGGRAAVPAALARLVTVRYALLAILLAILMIRPGLMARQALVFAAMLVIVALILGLVPLNWKRQRAQS
jgi:hypothetical protein